MANPAFDEHSNMIYESNIPALEQALNEGADINILNEVDSSNLAVD